MKKLILVFTTISLLSCTKKEVINPSSIPTSPSKTITSTNNCNKDSSWTRSHAKTTSLYYFKENCTHITITFAVTKKTVTVLKPTDKTILSNMDYANFRSSTDPNKIYYELYLNYDRKFIIYHVEEANFIGVGGPGIKI
jgi:predicted secreted acid phosphatase